MRRPARTPIAFALLCAVLAASCADGAGPTATPDATSSGPPRSFAMGLSSLPTELTEASYEEAFRLAATVGEVILIQRTPPWEEMLSGDLSEDTVRLTERETALASEHDLELFVAIDPIDIVAGQSEIGGLPADLRGAGFGDERVQQAFVAYARYVAQNYRPKYLALGVEVNSYQQQHPEDFERFVVLYHEAYEAVKEITPETLVFPTFQLEELQGLLPPDDPRPPQWYVINRFRPRMDLFAVSSFPGLAYEDIDVIPESYYAQLRAYADAPIAISSVGYPSDSAAGGRTAGGREEQAEFLRRTLKVAQQTESPLVVWFVGRDLGFTGEAASSFLTKTGLQEQDGTPKEAWRVWEEAARRPLERPTPAATPTAEATTQG